MGKIGGGTQVPQDETNRAAARARARRAHRRAAQGRRPVRVRPRRRGGRGAAGGGHPVRGRPRRHRRRRRPRLRGHPGHPARAGRAGSRSSPATRTRPRARPRSTGRRSPRFPGTLVFYMGVRALPRIAERLVAGGRSPDEPVVIVERGTLAGQRSVSGTLATIAERASAAAVRAPSVTIVGPVAALGDELAWLDAARPLSGRTVAVTRARAQASALAGRLRALGAAVVEAPAIAIEPLPVTVPDLAGYDLLCVTSPNGAARLLEEVRDARALAGPVIAAIGPGTARRAARRRHRARRGAGAGDRRVARGGAGRRAGAPRPDRPRRGGPRRAARRVARARRRGRRPRAVPDRGGAAGRCCARGGGRRGLRDVHVGLVGARRARRRRRRCGAPASSRSAR